MTAAQQLRSRTVPFGPVEIRYDERVLTPRSWTLLQSRWAAEIAREVPAGPVLELCAGAGQIGLAAAALTGRPLIQVDADPIACRYAVANAARAGLADQVEVRHGRIDTAIHVGEHFPIILADPPYLPSADVARWPEDPRSAIDGGTDGLDLVRACLEVADRHLLVDGMLLLQVAGDDQAQAVVAHLESADHLRLTPRATRHHDGHRAVMLLRAG